MICSRNVGLFVEKGNYIEISSCGFCLVGLDTASPKRKGSGNAERKRTGVATKVVANIWRHGCRKHQEIGGPENFVFLLFENLDLKGYVGGLGASAFGRFTYRPSSFGDDLGESFTVCGFLVVSTILST